MTSFTGDGLLITPQNLAQISPEPDDHGRSYHHDGSQEIDIVGGVTDNQRGLYTWDADALAWHPLFRNADMIDGKEAGDFLLVDGSTSLAGSLDLGTNKLLNASEIEGGTGRIHLNTNHFTLHSHSSGSNFQFLDADGLLLAEAQEGGDFSVPNGQLSEQGNRVATRTWTENTADVANADHADDANTLQGSGPSTFLQVSGDQMGGPLDLGGFDLNDGGTTKYDSSSGEFVQSALGGPAGSLSGYPLPASDLADDYALTSRFPMPDSDVSENYATETWVENNGGISAQNFEIVENSSTNSLDFNYTG